MNHEQKKAQPLTLQEVKPFCFQELSDVIEDAESELLTLAGNYNNFFKKALQKLNILLHLFT